jgi:hypothetical protein
LYAALFEELNPHSGMHHYEADWKREFIKNNSYVYKREVDFSFLNNTNKAYCEAFYSDGKKQTLNATRLISGGENNFKGWKCWINDSIFINPAGDIQLAIFLQIRFNLNLNRSVVRYRPVAAEPISISVKSAPST